METLSNRDLSTRFAETAFRWPFRRYQRLALDAYERDIAAGGRTAYIVMPPGSGKTVVGLEIARRRGHQTLILCPNTAVQAQWLHQWRDFLPETVTTAGETDLAAPISALTYQALCNLNTDDDALDEQALELWQDALQEDGDLSADQAAAEIQQLADADTPHYDAELARYRRRARRLIAQGGERDELLALLHPNGRELIDRMKETGSWTLVLDECHHLLEMWGYLVRAVVEELGDDVFVVGLTATPPRELDSRAAALYRDLFGRADFEVPIPAVVKEGDLAPYQELVYLTRPLEHEARFITEERVRLQELLTRLMDPDFASRPFLDWIRARVEERRAKDGAQLSWARFAQDEPALAQAALRLFLQTGVPLPKSARLGERHRQPPSADDWVALIEDYCLGRLRPSTDPRDLAAWETIRRALPSLGYVLTSRGIRSYVSPVDRVLALSASKATAVLTILELEEATLGSHLRALVLCDYERAGRELVAKLRGVLDPQAGSAALVLHLLVADPDVAELHPILMTGRTVACARMTAAALLAWIGEQVPELRDAIATEPLFTTSGAGEDAAWHDVVTVRPVHPWWRPRNYVPLITRYFEEGHSRCLVGTRGLLGEGWDAKRVNVLIDLTMASTATAVHQMRGRSLRLDPVLPRKVANNWDVVCVAPDHPKGTADYDRFVRKHRHYFAPNVAGEIESGVSHVHPDLSPYGSPPEQTFAEINAATLRRAGEREAAYQRWGIGQPYENRETQTVRVRLGRSLGLPGQRVLREVDARDDGSRLRQRAAVVGVAAAGVGAAGVTLGPDGVGLAVGLVTAMGGGVWLARSLDRVIRQLGPSDALEDFAAAVAEGLREVGGIAPDLGAAAVRIVPQADGYYRCYLAEAEEEDSRLFAESLDELLAPLDAPRYIIPRYVADTPRTALGTVGLLSRLLISRRTGSHVVYHAVPAYLAANRTRVGAFERAWHRYVSTGKALYWKNPRAQGILAAQRGEDPFDVLTQMRVLWR